jgi:tetratricopeptide (TPR) repeat protein
MWDSDTLAMEAKAFPDLPQVITGWFDRNPALYYEMRLKRVTERIAAAPDDLAAYDDAGVACDRLGRSEEAIDWMRRKRERLDLSGKNAPEVKEHRYRYHANLGTFLAHRWLKQGANRAKTDDLRAGRDHIVKAIAINPDAHFGREKYQLLVMEWLMNPRLGKSGETVTLSRYLGLEADSGLVTPGEGRLTEKEYREAIKGMSGLVVLGNAWESVDVYEALSHLLGAEGEASLAHLAALRCRELVEQGKRSLRPGAPTEANALLASLELVDAEQGRPPLLSERIRANAASYRALREGAEEANRERDEYMLARLRAGRHPDTDPAFWNDLPKRELPRLDLPWPRETLHRQFGPYWQVVLFLVSLLLGTPLTLFAAWRLWRRWKTARANV